MSWLIINGFHKKVLRVSFKSGVSLRAIQAYEQREKDINKASIINIKKLADALHCYIEDLIEEELHG